MQKILHLTKDWNVAVVGAGFLGHALAHYRGFQSRGFRVVCIFDDDEQKIDKEMGGLTVQNVDELEETVQKHDVQIGDTVVTSGFDGVYPKGLRLGWVSDVVKPEAEIFQEITVTPYVDFEKLEEVLVVLVSQRHEFTSEQ